MLVDHVIVTEIIEWIVVEISNKKYRLDGHYTLSSIGDGTI